MAVIEARNLVKIYGDLRAVDDISFAVEAGEVFGMLGPNGAGKSTTTEMIEGLRKPDGGTITVLGKDVTKHADAIKEQIGIQLQTTVMFQKLTVREMIQLFGSFYKKSLPVAEVISVVNLDEKAKTRSKDLSGGQRQRLAVAIALVNDPEIIFLDEPTTGLDPQARRSMWDVVANLQKRGKTVFMTTHYMEEAERLCDRVAVVDHGKIIAMGKPETLIAENFQETALEYETNEQLPLETVQTLPNVVRAQSENGITTLFSDGVARTTNGLMALVEQHNTELKNFRIRSASLEDVFLKLTGRHIRD